MLKNILRTIGQQTSGKVEVQRQRIADNLSDFFASHPLLAVHASGPVAKAEAVPAAVAIATATATATASAQTPHVSTAVSVANEPAHAANALSLSV